jgi:phosphopantothenoylcysteine synthetase/decarboxylase
MMRIVITGGPSTEPIDRVRTLTNRSTGELAVKMADRFTRAGHNVELFLGAGAIWRTESAKLFQTNEELASLLSRVQSAGEISLVLHAAALSDFKLREVTVVGGTGGTEKISSDAESVLLRLEPKPKLICLLRDWFPAAYLVGWKYEYDGTRQEVIEKGMRQLGANRTNACIVNGDAFGDGFGFCTEHGLLATMQTRDQLAAWLVDHFESLTKPHGFDR